MPYTCPACGRTWRHLAACALCAPAPAGPPRAAFRAQVNGLLDWLQHVGPVRGTITYSQGRADAGGVANHA